MINALEGWLIQCLENTFSKPYNKPLQALGLIPSSTAPLMKISHVVYTRNNFVFFVAFVALGFVVAAVCLAHLVLNMFTLHQIQHQYKAMLRIAFTSMRVDVVYLCLLPFMATFWCMLYLSPLFWAWNRRADRLNREPILPEPVPAEVPGVWPPPPVVSVNDVLKK